MKQPAKTSPTPTATRLSAHDLSTVTGGLRTFSSTELHLKRCTKACCISTSVIIGKGGQE